MYVTSFGSSDKLLLFNYNFQLLNYNALNGRRCLSVSFSNVVIKHVFNNSLRTHTHTLT